MPRSQTHTHTHTHARPNAVGSMQWRSQNFFTELRKSIVYHLQKLPYFAVSGLLQCLVWLWYSHKLSVFIACPHLIINAIRDINMTIPSVRPSVCPSVGCGHAGVVSKLIIEILIPPDSHIFLVFLAINIITKFGRRHS